MAAPEGGLPVHLPDGTLIGFARVRTGDGHLVLMDEQVLAVQVGRPRERVAELEAQLDRVERVRDRLAAKYGALQVAAQAFQIEAADSLDTIGRLDYEPDLGRRGTVECTDG